MDKTYLFSRLATCRHPRQSVKKHRLALLATILMLAFCMYPAKNHAQYYSVIEQGPHIDAYYFPTSVANWVDQPDKYSIAVVPYEYSQRIRLIEHINYYYNTTFLSGNVTDIKEIDVPDGIYIEDIETIGRYAVFCGRYEEGNYSAGVIGYFDIRDFTFMLSTDVCIKWSFIDSTTNIKELVVQQNAGLIHVVALGEKYVDNYRTHFVVEKTDLFSTAQADVARLTDNSTIRESAYEIKMTNNYIVLIGYESQDRALYFRRCSRSIGINDNEFNNIYYLSSYPTENLSKTHSTPMYSDYLTVSYLSSLSGTGDFATRIRILDVNKPGNTESQEIRLDDKSEPSEIVYLPGANRFVLLQNLHFPYDTSNIESLFIDIVPSTVPYMTPVYYYSGNYFYKIDNINHFGREYIALGGHDLYMIKDDTSPWPGTDASCPTKDSIKVGIIPNLPVLDRNVPLTHTMVNFGIKTDTPSIIPITPHSICTSD